MPDRTNLAAAGNKLAEPVTPELHGKTGRTWLVNADTWFAPLALLAVYLATALPPLVWRTLWFDELLEVYFASIPGIVPLLQAMATQPATVEPPLHDILMQISIRVLGTAEAGVRLPSFLAVLAGLFGLYRFIVRRSSPMHGLVAGALVCGSGAIYYAAEARPYGCVMGACGLSLLFWQNYSETRLRRFLILLSLTLCLALLSHYYAVLLPLPIIVGEFVRARQQKRILWSPILACIAPFGVCLLWLPFLHGAAGYGRVIWRATIEFPFWFYQDLTRPVWLIWIVTLVLAGLWCTRKTQNVSDESSNPSGFPLYEIAALVALAALPFFGYPLAKFVTRIFNLRYIVAASLGCAGLAAVLLREARSFDRKPIKALGVLLICAIAFLGLRQGRSIHQERTNFLAALDKNRTPNMATVIAEPHQFLPAFHYSNPESRKRLFFPLNESEMLEITQSDAVWLSLAALKRYDHDLEQSLPDLDEFLARNPSFEVDERADHAHAYVLTALERRRAKIELTGASGIDRRYSVTMGR